MGPTTGSIQGEETKASGAKAAAAAGGAAAPPPPPPEGPILALPAGSADPAMYKTRRTKKTKEVGEEEATTEKKRKKRRTMREINAEIDGAGDDDGDGSSAAWSPLSPPSADCKFPMSRLWRLIRSEGASGARTTPDAVFLINKASEMFLERFVEGVYQSAVKDRKKSISYRHLSSTVSSRTRYEFLSDFVPEKVKAEAALKTRTLVET
ncbi:uncharacterized protein LOC109715440 [Ananas comosus]|uniref:Uncharacterized protein LOC109715440 n=1 Tax=Ananas comosus TaxID=4615 RepID=A0A6P5FSG8_ANACO|nr:uncharacterized protein LOC109715440 [Ananas comosus]XP_020096020.1 uncharacterized protein LOC109715440 [Ananas comosus]